MIECEWSNHPVSQCTKLRRRKITYLNVVDHDHKARRIAKDYYNQKREP